MCQILKGFEAKGKQVVFRYPRLDDLSDFIKMHKILSEEKVMCGRFNYNEEKGREDLIKALSDVKDKRKITIFVIVDDMLCGYGHSAKSEGSYTHDYTTCNEESSHIKPLYR
ncbi:hypothetical protein KKC91_01245 [bacterium]|nr:hypothetical protein [bacterium]